MQSVRGQMHHEVVTMRDRQEIKERYPKLLRIALEKGLLSLVFKNSYRDFLFCLFFPGRCSMLAVCIKRSHDCHPEATADYLLLHRRGAIASKLSHGSLFTSQSTNGEITSAGHNSERRSGSTSSSTPKEHLEGLVMPTDENENRVLDPKNSQNIEGHTLLYAASENGR
ncbi:hypothetical protein HID58_073111 [Brassica napus]|uniref:Uncharacterized protein n=1 Tax=Brassica napus TaxID=3708 RepID=A0ABQ7Z6A8_BRANA|nr:hypothetical protein HID58_073111 [Brassica napus]